VGTIGFEPVQLADQTSVGPFVHEWRFLWRIGAVWEFAEEDFETGGLQAGAIFS
jgi:hypothetical protein